MNNEITVPVSDVFKTTTLTIRVSGVKIWTLRFRVMVFLLRLAGRIGPVGCKVEIEA